MSGGDQVVKGLVQKVRLTVLCLRCLTLRPLHLVLRDIKLIAARNPVQQAKVEADDFHIETGGQQQPHRLHQHCCYPRGSRIYSSCPRSRQTSWSAYASTDRPSLPLPAHPTPGCGYLWLATGIRSRLQVSSVSSASSRSCTSHCVKARFPGSLHPVTGLPVSTVRHAGEHNTPMPGKLLTTGSRIITSVAHLHH